MQIADRVADIPLSNIRKMFDRANALMAQGKQVIHLTSGLPDFDTPEFIKQAAQAALDRGEVKYTANAGIPELRQAIAAKLKKDNGLSYDPEGEIVVTLGVAEALFLVAMACLNPGDEIIVPAPYFPQYRYVTRMAEARLVEVPTRVENGFQPDPDELRAALTPKTKMILVTTPNNPTGAVWSREVLTAITALAVERDLTVISDEIYEKLIYDGLEHVSMAGLPGLRERTITLNGFSKSYAMTGWRLGYAAAPREIASAMTRVHGASVVCAASFAQRGGVAALTGPQDEVAAMVAEFDRRRLMMLERLSAMPGLEVARPQGAFYFLPKIKGLGLNSNQLAEQFLEKGGAAVVPWGPEYFRVSYANSYENLSKALDGMERVLKSL